MGLWICVLIPDWLRVCFLALEVCFFSLMSLHTNIDIIVVISLTLQML